MSVLRRLLWNRVMPHLRLPGSSTPVRSGRVLADLVLGTRFADLRGGYVDIDVVSEASPESHDPAREARLWAVCDELVADALTRG
jgi:hypothetical protein